MDKQTIIIAVLTALLSGSEYLSQSKKIEANGWIDLIKTFVSLVLVKFKGEVK